MGLEEKKRFIGIIVIIVVSLISGHLISQWYHAKRSQEAWEAGELFLQELRSKGYRIYYTTNVYQRDIHITNKTEFLNLLEALNITYLYLRSNPISALYFELYWIDTTDPADWKFYYIQYQDLLD